MCDLQVGSPNIDVVGVTDPTSGRLVVLVAVRETRLVCPRCGTVA